MSEYSELFDQALILNDIDAKNRQDLFSQVAVVLEKEGYVEDTYLDALNKREDEFPTGVVTEYLPIAMPHANPVNVKKPFIAVVQLNNPVHVLQMGLNEDEETQTFFFLGIVKETQELQVKLLQRFMQLMNSQEFVAKFEAVKNPTEMYQLLTIEF
ncbi:PTS sugar transporter subunit IIA [Latilactobacillus sakei]|uniref:PTS sugar transporter subunit IIA n=1 Tax=Lactobacillaceae TaxID=33958 RepID=UPI00201B060F|nr:MULTISPECIES: PTS sugar transporter subunit IIA [Lactobacillaceae]MCL5459490.1 PTS sugar transporter subunit IIA [Loigolactobacillus coryniformis]MCT3029042.1 PTS sugar transporter subunit IIA [Pediococcus parvulus]